MSTNKRARVHEYPRTHFAVAIDLREWSPARRKDRKPIEGLPSHLVNDKGRYRSSEIYSSEIYSSEIYSSKVTRQKLLVKFTRRARLVLLENPVLNVPVPA